MPRPSMLLAMFLAAPSAVDLATAGTGDLDQSFGVGGVVTRAIPMAVRGSEVLVQPDGRIVTVSVLPAAVSPAGGIGMARYLADGTLDQSFGTGGLVTLPLSSVSSWSPSGLLQPDGKIVASIDGAPGVLLVRYHEDGTPDAGFGAGGQIVLPGFGYPNSMVLHQGRLLVSMSGPSGPELRRFALSDGSPDAGFGTAGVVTGGLHHRRLQHRLARGPTGRQGADHGFEPARRAREPRRVAGRELRERWGGLAHAAN